MGRLSKIRRGKKPKKYRGYERFVWEQDKSAKADDPSGLHVLRDKETGKVIFSMFVGKAGEKCPLCEETGGCGVGVRHCSIGHRI